MKIQKQIQCQLQVFGNSLMNYNNTCFFFSDFSLRAVESPKLGQSEGPQGWSQEGWGAQGWGPHRMELLNFVFSSSRQTFHSFSPFWSLPVQ